VWIEKKARYIFLPDLLNEKLVEKSWRGWKIEGCG